MNKQIIAKELLKIAKELVSQLLDSSWNKTTFELQTILKHLNKENVKNVVELINNKYLRILMIAVKSKEKQFWRLYVKTSKNRYPRYRDYSSENIAVKQAKQIIEEYDLSNVKSIYQVGDILYVRDSWDYDTRYTFYKIIKKNNDSVRMVTLGKKYFQRKNGFGQGSYVVPDESEKGKIKTVKLNSKGELPYYHKWKGDKLQETYNN